MRLPRRLTASVAASTLIVTTLVGCDSGSGSGTKTEILIGADLALTSPADAAYGRALQLRVEQINASGELGDRSLALRILDNRSDPQSSLRNIDTLADDATVAALITGSCNECTVAASKNINDKKIPTVALASADEISSPVESRRYLFKLGPNSADSAATLADEIARVGHKKVGILYSDDLYGRGAQGQEQGALGHMRAALASVAVPVTAAVAVKPSATDLDPAVAELLEEEKPSAVVVLTGSDQATYAATSLKDAKFKGRVYFDANAAGDLFLTQEAAGPVNNATMVFTQILAIEDVIATTPAKAARKQWFRDYTARYDTYSGVAAFGADAISLIGDAVARAGGDRQQIRDILETSQTDGLSGPIRLTPDNHSALMPQSLTLLVARSGRWRLLS